MIKKRKRLKIPNLEVIRNHKLKRDREYNDQMKNDNKKNPKKQAKKKKKKQTTSYKTLHRKLKIEQHEANRNQRGTQVHRKDQ